MEYTMSQPLKRPLHNNLEKCPVVNHRDGMEYCILQRWLYHFQA
jgi:hypothetical protein